MSLLRWLKIPSVYIRKEAFSTTVLRRTDTEASAEKDSEPEPEPAEVITVETSIRYLKSNAYLKAYGDLPVWTYYRRNFRGQIPPDTRHSCIKGGKINNASPCPICRDKYLVVHYQNTDLLTQFISPNGGHVLETKKTGVCQKQHRNLLIAIEKAKDFGLISFEIPHRSYNYKVYKK